MTRQTARILAASLVLLPTSALAHGMHIGDNSGHSHAPEALGIALLAGAIAIFLARRGKRR